MGAAPSEKLSVSSGNILIDNNQAYRGNDTGGTARSLLTLANDDNLYVGSPSDITFQTNTNTSTVNAMTIASDGVVDFKGGRLVIGEADVASGHIDSFENLTFNIDTDNDDTNRYFSFTYNASAGAGTEVLRIDEADGTITGGGLKLSGGVFGHGSSDASSITLVGGNSSSTTGANITLGGTSGSATKEVIFKANSTETMRISADGAIGLAGENYGTSGQVLTSGGSSAAPTWTTLSDNDTTYTAGAGLSLSSTEFSADIGTSSSQVAAGNHNHDSDYQALDADTAKTDVVQTFTAGQRGEVTGLTDGANIAVNLNDSNNFSVTLGGNRTLDNPSNCTAGQSGIITITQPAGSTHTLVYGSYWKFSGGNAPNLTTTASAVDVLAYYVESADRITATLITDTK